SAWQTAQVVLQEIASEVREAFRTIRHDEERFERLMHFLQARKEQTLRQVHGFVRGGEQACRDCAVQGTSFLESKLTFWTTVNMIWRRDYWQRDFQDEMETKLRQIVQPQIENAVQLLETDLRGIWPQLQDMVESHFAGDAKSQAPRTPPDFARQRRELLQSIQLTLAERGGGNAIEEQRAVIFRETSDRLRIPAGVAAAGGGVALVEGLGSGTAVLMADTCLSLSLGNHEFVVVTIATPWPGPNVAQFHTLPAGHISSAQPEVIAPSRGAIETTSGIRVPFRSLMLENMLEM